MEFERTPLLRRNEEPEYVFQSSILKRRKEKIRQFQFCVFSIMLIGVIMLLVIATSYALNDQVAIINHDANNTKLPFQNSLLILSKLNALPDKMINRSIYSNESQWIDALNVGKDVVKLKENMEDQLQNLDENSPSYKHQKLLSSSEKIRNIVRIGFSEQYATKYLNSLNKNMTFACGSPRRNGTYPEYCNKHFRLCNPKSRYRSFNGTCNNLRKPEIYGVAYTPFRRILPPDYADGLAMPRISRTKKKLPSARTVSLHVHRPIFKSDPKFTVMLAVWGQFLDHDISATATILKNNGTPMSCCSESSKNYSECFPVMLDMHDPFYVKFNISCLEFIRSAPAPTCCLGPREQLNTASAFIDGSMIYGIDVNNVISLRTFINGSMQIQLTKDNRALLPISKDLQDGCNRQEEAKAGRYCFKTGDSRANENVHLTSMHLLWIRQHNFVADKLSKMNTHWNDEKVFQETRKILIAQIQHITYNEFLPNILGQHLMEVHDLLPKNNEYFYKYNDSLDSSISNVFAASAFRFAHSIIPNLIRTLGNNNTYEYIQMHKMLLDPFQLYSRYGIDNVIRGALDTNIQANDPYFASELKQHLFERIVEKQNNSKICGLDLVTLNIQRGRDHGLPGYTIWREHCGLFRPSTFEQLAGVIDDDSLNYISNIYSHPDDIDLYTGALSEKPLNDTLIGPTLICLIQDQFIRLKAGDRYWYENPFKPQAFTIDQLNEIRKTLLSRIICDNSDNVNTVQLYVMKRIDDTNKLFKCENIPQFNISYWNDTKISRLSLYNDVFKVEIMN